ncbi:M16 family metallopeptidase [Calderihabitans maritimus]|uniref:Peptidase M16-like protein n=1 Tax=Calderihabitans maritimus TaxID=1246530 RepID=A0A1Z5HQL5_9FIRM|nr:pitrilysin family protein [Calderihabitans maritimus]GAW91728.1 peptidase M16-like protein [Calderihabitans maritimus]
MYNKEVLGNGVRIVTEEIPYVHSVAIGIWVKTGSRNEPDNLHGVSHFIEHLLFKGTAKRSAKEIAEALDAVGGQLNAFTAKEYTCYYAKVLWEHLDLAIDVLTDMFFNARMDSRQIEKEKKVVLEEIKMYEDSPDELVHDLFAKTVWDGHPLGRAILGTEGSVKGLSREEIINYYHQQYRAENVVVAVAGRIKHEEVVEKLAPIFSNTRSLSLVDQLEEPLPSARMIFEKKDTEQVHICLGVPGLPQDHREIYTMYVLNSLLGGGLSSRLFQEVREERGLAYSIYTYHSTYLDSGLFTVYAATSPSNTSELLQVILQEIARLKEYGITEEELRRTKDQIKGNLLLGMENVTSRMSRLGKSEVCYGRVITAEEIVERIAKVEKIQVEELAKNLFDPDKFSLTCIGPESPTINLPHLLKKIGV